MHFCTYVQVDILVIGIEILFICHLFIQRSLLGSYCVPDTKQGNGKTKSDKTSSCSKGQVDKSVTDYQVE